MPPEQHGRIPKAEWGERRRERNEIQHSPIPSQEKCTCVKSYAFYKKAPRAIVKNAGRKTVGARHMGKNDRKEKERKREREEGKSAD